MEILQATPFLNVPDMKVALDRMTRVLRFEVTFQVSGYAYLECGKVAIRILEEPGTRLPLTPRITVYIDVSDIDTLYRDLLPALKTLPAEDVHPPCNQPWKQREFHVRLPDGNWLAYGQKIKGRDDSRQDEELED